MHESTMLFLLWLFGIRVFLAVRFFKKKKVLSVANNPSCYDMMIALSFVDRYKILISKGLTMLLNKLMTK